jgi:hypothetical protein
MGTTDSTPSCCGDTRDDAVNEQIKPTLQPSTHYSYLYQSMSPAPKTKKRRKKKKKPTPTLHIDLGHDQRNQPHSGIQMTEELSPLPDIDSSFKQNFQKSILISVNPMEPLATPKRDIKDFSQEVKHPNLANMAFDDIITSALDGNAKPDVETSTQKLEASQISTHEPQECEYSNGFYYGECTNGIPNGKGKMVYQDDSTYIGDFRHGRR